MVCIIDIIYKLGSLFIKELWSQNNIKILIQLNKYFTLEKWENAIGRFSNLKKYNCEIKYSDNKIRTFKLLKEANYFFSFSFNKHFIKNIDSLKMLYLAVRGTEELESLNIFPKIKISNIPPLSVQAISEYVLTVYLGLTKSLNRILINQCKKKWDQKYIIDNGFESFKNKIIGVAGYGCIGKEIARLFKSFGFTIYIWDKSCINDEDVVNRCYGYEDLNLFLKEIDVLIISLPLNKETENVFKLDTLKNMKSSSYIINISRGAIVKEEDLILMLKNKELKGAALDVFSEEPLPKNNDLWDLDNLIISPHIAGNINFFVEEIQVDFLKKISEEIENNV